MPRSLTDLGVPNLATLICESRLPAVALRAVIGLDGGCDSVPGMGGIGGIMMGAGPSLCLVSGEARGRESGEDSALTFLL